MAVQHGIWKIGDSPQAIHSIKIENERLLEEQIFKDISILNSNWLLIGRQVFTDFGKYIDLLAIDASGSVIVVELKKHRTPRDVVAQAIDYAAWVETLPSERIVQIYKDYAERWNVIEKSFSEAFRAKFGVVLTDDDVNSSHQMVIVAAELDASTERIITYLNDKCSIGVNAFFFSVFQDGDNQYLSRAWMIDPAETEEHAVQVAQKQGWNGEFYGSFGASPDSYNWEDARKYGFICAGGGHWYSKTLSMLEPGNRVWINIPKTGYVDVCEVLERVKPTDEFVHASKELRGIYKTIEEAGEDRADYFVPVRWIHEVPQAQAVNEIGLFGNQNSIARPRTPKWDYTVNRLKELWKI